MRFNIDTIDGKTTVTDKAPVELADGETIGEVMDELMQNVFERNRTYVSFLVGNRTVYFNPCNIVSITPVDDTLRSM